jgi:hypothetical protein
MKAKSVSITVVFILLYITLSAQSSAVTEHGKNSKVNFKVTTDIVSSYIWRGTIGNPNPNIQPTLAIFSEGFELGVWGSTDFLGSYKEVDPYITYTWKYFKIGITDYDWNFNSTNYFNYRKSETNHIFEGTLGFLGTEHFPVSLTINTMFYGSDKKWDAKSVSFSAKQNYSTYFEVGYVFGRSNIFLGVTPANGYYGAGYGKVNGFAVCNIGLNSTRIIKITPEFEIPLKGTICINPQSESIHFVIGITL